MAVDKKINYAIQGGGPNYLGKQKMVKAPKKWKSSPTHPEAHLAYITDKEQDLLIKKNLYGSLKGKPNKGPSGIVSLQGDLGGWSSGGGKGGGATDAGSGKGGGSSEDYKKADYYKMMTGTGTTATSAGGDTYRSKRLAKMATPEWGYTPSGQRKYVGSQVKGKQGWISKLLGRGNVQGARNLQAKKFWNPQLQQWDMRYESEDEELGQEKPGFGGRILGGLAGLATSIPFVGPMIGGAIDRYKPKPRDMSEFNRLGLGGTKQGTFDFNPNALINQKIPNVPMESLTMANWGNPPEEDQNFNMALPIGSAEGGRIGYAYGEDVNIEGPGFDENIQMASGVDPQDALNDMSMEIFGKGLHELTPDEYQILIDMANEQASAGQGQGEGLASLV